MPSVEKAMATIATATSGAGSSASFARGMVWREREKHGGDQALIKFWQRRSETAPETSGSRDPIVNPLSGEGERAMTADRQRLASNGGTLSPSDLEWLRRLPSDPAAVPVEDARTVLRLEAAVTDLSDKRLLRSIGDPLRAFHARATELAQARAVIDAHQPPAGLPGHLASPFGEPHRRLLAAAVQEEHPDLTEHEARRRAEEMLDAESQKRKAEVNAELAAANAKLAELAGVAS